MSINSCETFILQTTGFVF